VVNSQSILRSHLADAILLAGRLLLAFIFLHEGITLATHFDNTVKAMSATGISAPLVVAVIALQLCAGLSVALGVLPRIGAALLGLFASRRQCCSIRTSPIKMNCCILKRISPSQAACSSWRPWARGRWLSGDLFNSSTELRREADGL
jgi:hypothetical protein